MPLHHKPLEETITIKKAEYDRLIAENKKLKMNDAFVAELEDENTMMAAEIDKMMMAAEIDKLNAYKGRNFTTAFSSPDAVF